MPSRRGFLTLLAGLAVPWKGKGKTEKPPTYFGSEQHAEDEGRAAMRYHYSYVNTRTGEETPLRADRTVLMTSHGRVLMTAQRSRPRS